MYTWNIVQIKTTVVFDDPTKVERIEQDSFIVHARYFGRVAAFSSFSDAVAGVPYNGIRVQRIPEKFSHMGVSWFIPPQPLSHPSRMQFHQVMKTALGENRSLDDMGALHSLVVLEVFRKEIDP
ncbi:unnamed protein product [Toxocara canis]|uniref:HotDog ACOT-type domain-containing protein n=1 Tax=Toxocara canis TaxID=6265 RepID=A0A183U5A9_TOXCA|nr:unnamed protein product [Toxocara canis]